MSAAVTLPIPEHHEIVLRLATEEDMRFITDAWVKSYAGIMPDYAKTYGMSRWDWIKACATWCIANSQVALAHVETYPDAILGWGCGQPGTMHYVYVLHEARRHGLGRMLIAGLGNAERRGVRITHRPYPKLRKKVDALGWYWKPLTRDEVLGG